MKKEILSLIITTSILNYNYATACNQTTRDKKYDKNIHENICIPEGYWITMIGNGTKKCDYNSDGIEDLVVMWSKKGDLNLGDTLFTSIYRQDSLKNFTFWKTLGNLERYIGNYIHYVSLDGKWPTNKQDSLFIDKYYEVYGETYPLQSLTIEKNYIIIELGYDDHPYRTILVTYKYNKSLDNYCFEKCEYHNTLPPENNIITHEYDNIFGPTIDDFTYFYNVKKIKDK